MNKELIFNKFFSHRDHIKYLYLIAGFLFLGGLALFLIADDESLIYISDVLLPIYNTLATGALFYAAWYARGHSRPDYLAWLLIAISQLVYTIADFTWLYIEVILGLEPFPSIADIFYLLYYPLFLAGILFFPFERIVYHERRKIILEMLIIMIATALYFENFIVEPILHDIESADFLYKTFSIAYPMMDMGLLFALIYFAFRVTKQVHYDSIALLAFSMVTTLVADISFSITNLEGTYMVQRLLDFGYPASYLLVGLAGIVSTQLIKEPPDAASDNVGWKSYHRHITGLMLLSAFVLLVAGYFKELSLSYIELSVWVGGLVVLSIIVQIIDAEDISKLNNRLSRINNELEERVQQRTIELGQINQELREEILARQEVMSELEVSETLYRAVVEDLPMFICRFQGDGTLTFVNNAYCEYFNSSREDLIGRSFFTLIPESDRDYVRKHYQSLNVNNPMVSYEHRVFSAAGEVRWQRWIDRAIFENDTLVEYQSIGEDVTEQRRSQQALRESEERFRDLFDNSTNLIQIVSPDGKFFYVNQAWKSILGYTETDIDGMSVWEVFQPDYVEVVRNAFERTLAGEVFTNLEVVFLTKNQHQVYAEGNINVKYIDGKVAYIRAIFHDITERKNIEEQLYHNAYYDALTGLPNRAFLLEQITRVMAEASSDPGKNYSLFFLDVDNFKLVNDTLGHVFGDNLLVAISNRLKECLRSVDIVGRLGGDEFVVLLSRVSKLDYVYEVANRVLNELSRPFSIDGHEINIHVSIGVVYNGLEGDAQSILRDADIAMYRAKVLGKNRIALFQDRMREDTISRVRLENDLRQAIQEGQFFLQYQPILSVGNNELRGLEALLRWQHPTRGVISPLYFIPIAEETGLIISIGEWVLREACQQMMVWQEKYPTHPPLQININISAKQLAYSNLVDFIRNVLKETGLNPACLALEITESTIMENIEIANEILTNLHSEGIQIHVDDFGTGYSSLHRLISLPIQAVKIDRSFIKEMNQVGGSSGIVRAITTMGKELHLETIAEGVENEQQLTLLQELKCDAAQGFYFSKPISADDIQEFLRQHLMN